MGIQLTKLDSGNGGSLCTLQLVTWTLYSPFACARYQAKSYQKHFEAIKRCLSDADHCGMSRFKTEVRGKSQFLRDRLNTMAEQNVPTQPPTRTDEQMHSLPQQMFLYLPATVLENKERLLSSDKPDTQFAMLWGKSSTQTNVVLESVMGRVAEEYKGKKPHQESASVHLQQKRATPKKPTTTTPVKQSKPAPPPTKKPSKRKLPQKVRKGKPTFQLVDEDDEAQQESITQEEGNDPDLELAKKMSLEAHQEKGEGEGRAPVGGVTIRDPVSKTTSKLHEVVGKGKAIVTKEQLAHSLIDLSKKKRTTDQFILVRRDQSPHDSTTGPSSQPEDDTSEKVYP
ncbi:hypothetical protein Tco_0818063 [Tanacetum coccineum]